MANMHPPAVLASEQDDTEHPNDISQDQPTTVVDEIDELKRRLEDLPPELYSMIYDFTFTFYLPTRAPDEVTRTFRFPIQFQINREIREDTAADLLEWLCVENMLCAHRNVSTPVFIWWMLSAGLMSYWRKVDLECVMEVPSEREPESTHSRGANGQSMDGEKLAAFNARWKDGQPFSLQDWRSNPESDAKAFCRGSWLTRRLFRLGMEFVKEAILEAPAEEERAGWSWELSVLQWAQRKTLRGCCFGE
jgi:hypothetical protein